MCVTLCAEGARLEERLGVEDAALVHVEPRLGHEPTLLIVQYTILYNTIIFGMQYSPGAQTHTRNCVTLVIVFTLVHVEPRLGH